MKQDMKILFVDIDGTLTNNKGIITDYTKEVIEKATKKGIYVILCSGRANSDLIEKSKIAKSTPIVISSNGTLVFDYSKNIKIYESNIDFKFLEDIWNFSLENNIDLTFNSIYRRFKTINSKKDANIISSLHELDEHVTQIVAESKSYKSIESLTHFIKKIETLKCGVPISQYDINNDMYYDMDIYNEKNDKGRAITILLNYLNLDKNSAMCIGDGINDYSMFDACGHKVAMSNGNHKLKEKADFITEYTNDEDGVAKFINSFFNEKVLIS